jgi:hypothetical protein
MTKYLPDETFDTYLQAGQVLGNLSSVSMSLAGIQIENVTAGARHLIIV